MDTPPTIRVPGRIDYSSHLPVVYRESAQQESSLHRQDVITKIVNGACLCDETLLSLGIRKCTTYLDLKNELLGPDRVTLATVLTNFVVSPHGTISTRKKAAKLAARLLKKFDVVSPEGPQYDWRALYEVFERDIFAKSNEWVYSGDDEFAGFRSAMVVLVRRWRRYFTAEDATQILAALEPMLCVHNDILFKGVGLLTLFYPVKEASDIVVNHALVFWPLVDQCREWDLMWMMFIARIAKAQVGVRDWASALDTIYTHMLRMVSVSLGNFGRDQPVHHRSLPREFRFLMGSVAPNAHQSSMRGIAKFMVYTVGTTLGATSRVITLFNGISHYYHPLNSGSWSSRLAQLLLSFTSRLSKRIGEQRREVRSLPPGAQLSMEDIRRLSSTLLPIVEQGQYSKNINMARFADYAFKSLVAIDGDFVLPAFLTRVVPALQTVDKTHQTLSAISTLGVCVREVLDRQKFPAGPELLREMLTLTVPGLDPNDMMKTAGTLKLYINFLSIVPLIDCTSAPSKAVTEADHTARAATGMFEDWATEVIDRLLRVFMQLDKPSKSSPAGILTGMGKTMYKTFGDLFFSQLPSQLRGRIVTKLVNFVMDNPHIEGGAIIGQFCGSATLTEPEVLLKALIPRIERSFMDGSEINEHISERLLQWYLMLLGGAVRRSGASVLEYVPFLERLIDFALVHESKSIVKFGGKLLRRLLQGLGKIYPVEYRAVGPSTWASEDYQSNHYMSWTTGFKEVSPDDFEMTWHVPTAEEQAVVDRLCEKHLGAAAASLEKAKENTETLDSDAKHGIWQALKTARAVLRGAPPPELEQPTSKASSDYDSPRISPTSGCCSGGSEALRKAFGQTLLGFLDWLLAYRPDDVKTTRLAVKTSSLFQVFRGGLADNKAASKSLHVYSAFKFIVSDLILGSRARPRWLVIEKMRNLHERRIGQRIWLPPQEAEIYNGLTERFMKLATSNYAKVRGVAQSALHRCFLYFPIYTKATLGSFITENLGNKSEEDDHRVTGAIYTLTNNHILRKISRDPSLLKALLLTLASAVSHSKPTVAARAGELFSSLTRLWHQPAALPADDWSPMPSGQPTLATSDVITKARQHHGTKVDLADQARAALAVDLVKLAQNEKSWKTNVTVCASLLCLSSRTSLLSPEVLVWLSENLSHEVGPVRTSALWSLVIIGGLVLDPVSSDSKYVGWNNASASGAELPSAPPANGTEIGNALTQVKDSFDRALGFMHADHREESESKGQKSGNIFDSRHFGRSLQFTRSWPETRWAEPSSSFSHHNAWFFRRLFEFCPDPLSFVKGNVEEFLSAQGSRASQTTAAEIIAGAIVGSSKIGDAVSLDQAKSWFLSWFDDASGGEGLAEWCTACRFVVSQVPQSQLGWLLEPAFSCPSTDASSTFLCKRLRIARTVMKELTWQVDGQTLAFINQFKGNGFLCHPLKQVRSEVSRTLTVFAGNSVTQDGSMSSGFQQWFADWLEVLNADISDGNVEGEPKQRADIVFQWMIASFHHADIVAIEAVLPRLLNLMYAYIDHKDSDVANTAKTVLRYVSQANIGIGGIKSVAVELSTLLSSTNWHVREAVLPVLQEIAFRGMFLHLKGPDGKCQDSVIKALEDSQIEVRLLARNTLASMIKGLSLYQDSEEREAIISKFSKRGRVKIPDTTVIERVLRRHSGVLGLESLVLANAFDVPEWLVDVVMEVCGHTRDPNPIRDSVKKTLAEFWRTHADTWSQYEHLFTPDDLERLMDLVSAPSSYFS